MAKLNRNQMMGVGALLLIVVAAVAMTNGAFQSSFGSIIGVGQVESVTSSGVTIDGQPGVRVVIRADQSADMLDVTWLKSQFPDWNTDIPGHAAIIKSNSVFRLYATELPVGNGVSTINPTATLACNGINLNPLGSYAGFCNEKKTNGQFRWNTFSDFQNECATKGQFGYSPIAVEGGNAAYPQWRCYVRTPKWIVSTLGLQDANTVATLTVQAWGTDANGNEKIGEATLTNNNNADALMTADGVKLGDANLGGTITTYTTFTGTGDVKLVRDYASFGPGFAYTLVLDSGITSLRTSAENELNACIGISQNTNILSGPQDVNKVQSCINAFNTNIQKIGTAVPTTGTFATSNIVLENGQTYVDIPNKYTIPRVVITLNAEKVGIVRAQSKPMSVSCSLPDFRAGEEGSLLVTMQNNEVAGSLNLEASCTSPVTVKSFTSPISFGMNQQKQVQIGLNSMAQGGNYVCTVTAKPYVPNTADNKVATCNGVATGICNKPEKLGWSLEDCVYVCKLTSCPSGQSLTTPATGYPDDCTCVTNPPQPCPSGQQRNTEGVCVSKCPTGQLWDADSSSCKIDCPSPKIVENGVCKDVIVPPMCMPIIQKVSTQTIGGWNFFGFNIGGTQASKCDWDYMPFGIVISVIGGILLVMNKNGKNKDAVIIGKALLAVGLLLIVLSLVAGAGLVLWLGGTGILFIVIALLIVWAFIKFVL